jgi:ATP-binding cassette, subfamily B, bacterial PglK
MILGSFFNLRKFFLITKIIKKVNIDLYNRYLKLLIFASFALILEIIGIGIIVPVINFFVSENNSKVDVFITVLDFSSYEREELILYSFVFILLFNVLKTGYISFNTYLQSLFISDLNSKSCEELYKNYLYQSYFFHVNNSAEKLIFNIQTEVSLFIDLVKAFLYFISEIALVICLILVLLFFEPIGTLTIGFFLISLSFIYTSLINKKLKNWGVLRQKFDKLRFRNLSDGINGFKEIIILNKQNFFSKNYSSSNKVFSRILSNFYFISQFSKIFLEFMTIFSVVGIVVLFYFLNYPLDKLLTILALYLVVAFRMLPSVNKIINSMQSLKYGIPTLNLINNEIINNSLKISDNNDKKLKFNKNIICENLSFNYDNQKKIINKINIKINKGENIGIVGPSGSGKSTFINVLLGLIEPSNGDILVDGVSVKNRLNGWRKNIGYVPQAIFLTNDSVKANVAFGLHDDEIDELRVLECLKQAQLDDFVESLSSGIDTNVGDKGLKISGGQKQRIGIARALYYDPDILIFDEATSSLDSRTEEKFLNVVKKIGVNKTIISVAHRKNTLKDSDFIYEISSGKLNQIK